MTAKFTPLQGGCLCGDVRFQIKAPPIQSGYCHCRMCQRNSGAPAVAWFSVLVHDFAYVAGRPAAFRSSAHGQREFCPRCGSYLVFRDDTPEIGVNTASLDDPGAVPPTFHIYWESHIDWFDTADTLPRYEKGLP